MKTLVGFNKKLGREKGTSKLVKMSDLKFDKDVRKGDSIPMKPFSDALLQIDTESDLNSLQLSYPDAIVVIDRKKAWHKVFTIPAWSEEQADYRAIKIEALKQLGTND